MRRAACGRIDIALWDIQGKHYGRPVHELLGGMVRPRASFGAYAYAIRSPDTQSAIAEMVAHAADLVGETGARLFEFKIGVDVDADIEIIRQLREKLPVHVALAADANLGLEFEDAFRLLGSIPQGALANIEEPCATLDECERLGQIFGLPVSSHVTDPMALRSYPGISGAVPTLELAGGISEIMRLAPALAALGRRSWLRSLAEFGISWAAMVHVGSTAREFRRPGQSLIHLMESTLVDGEPWLVRSGGVVPPQTPGLGVSLDQAALAEYHDLFKARGESDLFVPAIDASRPQGCG